MEHKMSDNKEMMSDICIDATDNEDKDKQSWSKVHSGLYYEQYNR